MIPLTSTIVATKGAEDTAGSSPTLERMKGSIAPITLPNKTINNKLEATTVAFKTNSIFKGSPSIKPHAISVAKPNTP